MTYLEIIENLPILKDELIQTMRYRPIGRLKTNYKGINTTVICQDSSTSIIIKDNYSINVHKDFGGDIILIVFKFTVNEEKSYTVQYKNTEYVFKDSIYKLLLPFYDDIISDDEFLFELNLTKTHKIPIDFVLDSFHIFKYLRGIIECLKKF